MSEPRRRHDLLSIAFHWACALCAVGAVAVGVYMTRGGVDFGSQFRLQQIHKSLGVLVFVLTVAWLVWRLAGPARGTVQTSSRLTRASLFALLVAAPLSGWVLVSAAVFKVPTFVFGAIWLPHLPWFDGAADPQATANVAETMHSGLAIAFVLVIVLHLGQTVRSGRNVLDMMLPTRRR